MNDVEMKVGGLNVIASGTLLFYGKETISIKIDPQDKNDNQLTVNIELISKDNEKPQLLLTGHGSEATFTLINLVNSLAGWSPMEPVDIASNKTSVLSFFFRIVSSGTSGVIYYTMFRRNKRKKTSHDNAKKN